MQGDLFDRLKATCAGDWKAYVNHDFVKQLGAGTLPQACFQHYLKQDYLFLIQFARAFALAAYKSESLADIRMAHGSMKAILDTELDLHIDFCRKWGIEPEELEDLPEATANMAYTRYVHGAGMAGTILELHVALAPCLLGYAEIAQRLMNDPATVTDGNRYKDWIDMYAGEEYQEAAEEAARYLDRLAAGITTERFEGLAKTFRDATRLEVGFWQMGLDQSM